MAFESRILVDGEWATRTFDVNTVLRHYNQQDKEASTNNVEIEGAPVLGLLTQTVIRSPLVRWILPAKLRDLDTNDVAFIGDEFVQIKELRPDGHLWDVIQKENFGARIRNALVVGSTEAYKRDRGQQAQSTKIKPEDNGDDMDIDGKPKENHQPSNLVLPPQSILLQLDTGDSVVLMLHQSVRGTLKFISNRHRASKSMLRTQPGMHLTIDPSSRYMAIGCSEGLFAIYALNSREELQRQLSLGASLRYVESERHIYLQGVIHKIEFLYPSADDEEHVILLVLMIRKGKTRMLLYEWETGGDLREIRAHNRRGHLLEEALQMPLLIIPLTIKSSFILVSAKSMSICQDILQGSPRFTDVNDRVDPPTPLFHGSDIPLWTSWTRPVRLPQYKISHDDIYIAREDGLLKFIETDCEEEQLVKTEMIIGNLSTNCGPALASLDYSTYNDSKKTGDLLITAGDSSAGGTYLIKAREAPSFTEPIQNWTPAQDFVTISRNEQDDQYPVLSTSSKNHQDVIPHPDRIFTCVGRGTNGAITEFRYGLQASIGLIMAYDTRILDVWVLSPDDSLHADGGSLFLLSLGDRSSLLHLLDDATQITELGQDATKFDLRSRTIAAGMQGGFNIQVTEQSIVVIIGSKSEILDGEALLGIRESGTLPAQAEKVELAVIYGNVVVFTIRIGYTSYLQVLELKSPVDIIEDMPVFSSIGLPRNLRRCTSDVTCVATCSVSESVCAVVAEYDRDSIRLIFEPLNAGNTQILNVPVTCEEGHLRIEAIVSIAVASGFPGSLLLVCGTRNGVVVTLEIDESTFQIVRRWYDRVGVTPVALKRDEYPGTRNLVFVNCDMKVYAFTTPPAELSTPSIQSRRRIRQIYPVYLTDARNPILQQPAVSCMARLRPSLSHGADGGLLLFGDSQIFLSSFSSQPKAVPRYIPIGGSPSRLLYSHHLDCLIVAASVDGRCTILFIDPDTGENISESVDKKNGKPIDFASGLGSYNERVFRLLEWSYNKGGKVWRFIIVSTNTGRLLIISTQNDEPAQMTGSEVPFDQKPGKRIRYWTLHRFKCVEPIYSVAGFEDGLYYCAGDILYCETLDISEKRFKRVAEYTLPSPALHLAYKDKRIYALTSVHSLEILEVKTPDESLDLALRNGAASKIIRTHGDQVSRNSLHHIPVSPSSQSSQGPIELISDKSCSVVGLWATRNSRADTLETVFEAQLPYSIIKFRLGKCRPAWDVSWRSSSDNGEWVPDLVPNSASYPEILGLSINGSLCNMTILDFAAWKFLRFLINLAKQSPKVCEFTYNQDAQTLEPVHEPKGMMHVDGDILRRCLKDESLGELLCIGQETEEAKRTQAKFIELLQELHRGKLDKNAAVDIYIEHAYKGLEFFLRPVM